MYLFVVMYGNKTGFRFVLRSIEHVWANNHKEAEVFARKHCDGLDYKVNMVYAAATTVDYRTPPGLETYTVETGKKS